MTLKDQAQDILAHFNGLIPAKQVVEEGLTSYAALSRMTRAGLLERVGPGIYLDPLQFEDGFAVAQMRLSRGIFFKETALYLHDLTDRTPDRLEMNFPNGVTTNLSQSVALGVMAYHQVPHLYHLGVTTSETPSGNTVRVYNAERTLCDIIRAPHIAQPEIIGNAFRTYVSRRGKNIPRLMAYAEQLGVEAKVYAYLEVLL